MTGPPPASPSPSSGPELGAGGGALVIPVRSEDGAVPSLDLVAAAEWFREASGEAFRPVFPSLAPVDLPLPLAAYRGRGGMGPWPANSQRLAADAAAAARSSLEGAWTEGLPGIVLVVPRGFHPHTWRFRGGGFALGRARWLRRYALLPGDAPLGTVVHELAHLLLGWPDLGRGSGLGRDCLMAEGAGAPPSPPCAPLRLAAGWCRPFPLLRETPLAALDSGGVGAFPSEGPPRLVEARRARSGGGVLLAYAVPEPLAPRLIARIPYGDDDLRRPVLALVAPFVRGATPRGAGSG